MTFVTVATPRLRLSLGKHRWWKRAVAIVMQTSVQCVQKGRATKSLDKWAITISKLELPSKAVSRQRDWGKPLLNPLGLKSPMRDMITLLISQFACLLMKWHVFLHEDPLCLVCGIAAWTGWITSDNLGVFRTREFTRRHVTRVFLQSGFGGALICENVGGVTVA